MAFDILREMENLRREIDSAFKGFGVGNYLEPAFLPGLSTGRYPQVNLAEDQDNLYVEILVPGVSSKELNLTVMRGVLTVSGERKEEAYTEKIWHRRERGLGKFMRTIDLPCEVDTDKIVAKFENGVLFVTLPKREKDRPKKVSVVAK